MVEAAGREQRERRRRGQRRRGEDDRRRRRRKDAGRTEASTASGGAIAPLQASTWRRSREGEISGDETRLVRTAAASCDGLTGAPRSSSETRWPRWCGSVQTRAPRPCSCRERGSTRKARWMTTAGRGCDGGNTADEQRGQRARRRERAGRLLLWRHRSTRGTESSAATRAERRRSECRVQCALLTCAWRCCSEVVTSSAGGVRRLGGVVGVVRCGRCCMGGLVQSSASAQQQPLSAK